MDSLKKEQQYILERVLYAKINNYDLIEGYFVKSKEEKNIILSKTFMTKESWPI